MSIKKNRIFRGAINVKHFFSVIRKLFRIRIRSSVFLKGDLLYRCRQKRKKNAKVKSTLDLIGCKVVIHYFIMESVSLLVSICKAD